MSSVSDSPFVALLWNKPSSISIGRLHSSNLNNNTNSNFFARCKQCGVLLWKATLKWHEV
jgi:hypothetical protein